MSGKDYGPNCDFLPDDLLKEARQRTGIKNYPGYRAWIDCVAGAEEK